MDRVEGTERPGGGDGTDGLADAASDSPQLTSGPDRGKVPLGVNQPLLGSAAESALLRSLFRAHFIDAHNISKLSGGTPDYVGFGEETPARG